MIRIVSPIFLILASCGDYKSPQSDQAKEHGQNEMPSSLEDDLNDVLSTVNAAQFTQSLSLYLNGDNTLTITGKNERAVEFLIQRIVVNDLNGDSKCDIRFFDRVPKDETVEFEFLNCGVIRRITVFYQDGNGVGTSLAVDMDRDAFITISSDIREGEEGFGNYITITNKSSRQYELRSILINGLSENDECHRRIFENLLPNQSFSMRYFEDVCGQPRSIAVITDAGNREFSFGR